MDHFTTRLARTGYEIDSLAAEEQLKVTDHIANRLAEIENEIFLHPHRKGMFRIKGWFSRTLITPSGTVNFRRRLYIDKVTEQAVFLLDLACHIEKYSRLTAAAVCRVAEYALTSQSYAQAGQMALINTPVSRQTVLNCMDRVRFDTPPDTFQPSAHVLHISVDGFYTNYAKQHHKREIKFASIATGIETLTPTRNRLINKILVSPNHSHQPLAEALHAAIKAHYHVYPDTKIFILGDGARWIRELTQQFSNAYFVIDPFHFIRAIRSLPNATQVAELARQLDSAALRVLRNQCEDENERKTLNYILFHLKSTIHWSDPDFIGCHTEHVVSHYFHHRLRSKPRTWSQRLFKMAALIASSYHSFTSIHFEETRSYPVTIDHLFTQPEIITPRFTYDYAAPILNSPTTARTIQIKNLLYGY